MALITRDGAAALIPEEVTREVLSGVTNEGSAALAKMKRLPNMARNVLRMPVLSALPTAYFVAGSERTSPPGEKQTADVEWANKYVYAEEVACIVPIGEDVLDDADYPIWSEVQPLLTAEFGRVLDAAILHGVDAPATWPDGIVPDADAAGNVVVAGTGADLYEDILMEDGVWAAVENDGYLVSGAVGAIPLMAALRGVRDEVAQPIFKRERMQDKTTYAIDGVDVTFPRNGGIDPTEALLIAGDWSKAVYSVRQELTFKLLTEATITVGETSYNLAQQDMVALRAVMRIGWQVPNPLNRINETEGTRYPFGVLAPAAGSGSGS